MPSPSGLQTARSRLLAPLVVGALVVAGLTVAATEASASAVIVSDAFNRTRASGWGAADVGGAWQLNGSTALSNVNNGVGHLSIGRGRSLAAYVGRNATNVTAAAVMSTDRSAKGGALYASLIGRRTASGDTYRATVQVDGTSAAHLTITKGGGGTGIALSSTITVPGFTYAPGARLRIALQVTGKSPTTLRAKAWAYGRTEPSWQLTTTDSTTALQAAGNVGVQGYGTSTMASAAVVLGVDSIAASDLDSTAPPTGTVCTNPYFTTSASNGGITDHGYYVHNNLWNAAGYPGTKGTTQVCSYHSWNHIGVASNTSHDGAVKTYPNVHKDYSGRTINSFPRLVSSFAATPPGVGIYNVAYDLWLNGVPNDEVMIWTDNHNQVPAGTRFATNVALSGYHWDAYAVSGNGYIMFLPSGGARITAGTLDIKAMLLYLVGQGRVAAGSTVDAICYGVEIVDTGGVPATWKFTNFSITDT